MFLSAKSIIQYFVSTYLGKGWKLRLSLANQSDGAKNVTALRDMRDTLSSDYPSLARRGRSFHCLTSYVETEHIKLALIQSRRDHEIKSNYSKVESEKGRENGSSQTHLNRP